MVKGANITPHMVLNFLTRRPMQSGDKNPSQPNTDHDVLETTLQAQHIIVHTNMRDTS